MADSLLFTLTLKGIVFDEEGFPRYPTLIDYNAQGLGSLKPEPALKCLPISGPAGPFEVIFSLEAKQPTQFEVDSNGDFVLRRIDGRPVDEPFWEVLLDEQRMVCTVTWTGTLPPQTQVLRLDCTPNPVDPSHQPRYLFLGLVNTLALETRTTNAPRPPEQRSLPFLLAEKHPDYGLTFSMFLLEAYSQLAGKYQFEPALRIRHGASLQFLIDLGPSVESIFGSGQRNPGTDEVPVKLPKKEFEAGKSDFLDPTQRPSSRQCVVTWNQNRGRLGDGNYIVFNLQLESPDKSLHHTLDPTIIEEPPAAPPVNGGAKSDH